MIIKIYKYLNILSVDVVGGACLNTWLISHFLSVQIPLICYLCLGISVWLIYTADRLLDVYKITHRASSKRHRFHQDHFRQILFSFLLGSFVNFIMIFFLPANVLFAGFGLGIVTLVYLASISWLKSRFSYIKEVFIALIYSSAVFIIPLSFNYSYFKSCFVILFLQLFLIAFLNLIIFSFNEKDEDEKDTFRSIIFLIGTSKSKKVINLLIFLLFASFLVVVQYVEGDFLYVEAIYFLMTIVLAWIHRKKEIFLKGEPYRIVGDMVFLFPVILFAYDYF